MKRLLASLLTVFCLALPATAYAFNPLSDACNSGGDNGGAASSTACASNGSQDPISGPNGILMKASLVIATLAGIAAVIIMIVAGIQYITSAGDANKAAGARSAIIGAAIGLAIVAAAEGIIVFVVRKL
jgi:uncharacterized protein (DUF2345 family)